MKRILLYTILVCLVLWQVSAGFAATKAASPGIGEDPQVIRQNKDKQKQSMGDLVQIGRAVEKYLAEHDGHAPAAKTIGDLKKILVPKYIQDMPLKDGWGHPYFYKVWSEYPGIYFLATGGADGKLEWIGKKEFLPVTSLEHFNRDVVFSGGVFVSGPKVK